MNSVSSLEEISEKFSAYRSVSRKRARLPEELWTMVLSACKRHPLTSVARASGLDYYQLKTKFENQKPSLMQLTCSEVVEVKGEQAASDMPILQLTHPNGLTLAFYQNSPTLEKLLGEFFRKC